MMKIFFLAGILLSQMASAQKRRHEDINTVINHYFEVKKTPGQRGWKPCFLTHAKDLLASVEAVNTANLTDAQRKIWVTYEPKASNMIAATSAKSTG